MRSETVRLETGVAPLDTLTDGGLPMGAVTELVGVEGSGRTTLAMTFVARRVEEGQVCAWVDASDVLDPEAAASAGVDLERLLWVRCGISEAGEAGARTGSDGASSGTPTSSGLSIASGLSTASGAAIGVSIDRSVSVPSSPGGCGSPHPRGEGKGLPEAIATLLSNTGDRQQRPGKGSAFVPLRRQDRSVGTPGAPNRLVSDRAEAAGFPRRSADRVEQVASDRLPSRRVGANSPARWDPRCADPQPGRRAAAQNREDAIKGAGSVPAWQSAPASRPSLTDAGLPASVGVKGLGHTWRGLDQALRAADLILQGGGFGVVVLDLGSLPPEVVWRVPLATWFRFRAAAERTRASLLLLTQHACARSSAELVLEMAAGEVTAQGRVMTGMAYQAAVGRQRFPAGQPEAGQPEMVEPEKVVSMRKPPQPERLSAWSGQASWASHRGTGSTGNQLGKKR